MPKNTKGFTERPPSTKGKARAGKRPAKGWSARRRKQQACNARRTKPWQSSTGPRTESGKKASRMNALKHGNRSGANAALRRALCLHSAFMRHICTYDAVTRQVDEILANKRTEEKISKIMEIARAENAAADRSEGI